LLEKNYDAGLEVEMFEEWLEKGYFRAKVDWAKKAFSVVIPPPNITGVLHMGHALNNTVQDVIVRMKRMQGFEVLWQPGTDHAAIATEVKVIEKLAEDGLTKAEIGREAFLKRVWKWKEEYGGTIVRQLKRLGSSCDWERERFTMDEGLSEAVLEVFVRLYDEGKIYRGEKLINWCTHCRTTISDAEVVHKDAESVLYYLKYELVEGGGFISFATTRPETMFGDTAIAVNPEDERYKGLVGKMVKVPFGDRAIPIIADEHVEKDFGTGALKITPAHAPNDFEVGWRHGLPSINALNDDGTLNAFATPIPGTEPYEGLTLAAARERTVREMDERGWLIKSEKIQNSLGVHDRCGTVVEPLIKLQWFVRMKELAEPAIEAYKSGEVTFNREQYGKVYLHWLNNIKDWCISRQLWWGHRIPAYYCQSCRHTVVAREMPDICPKCRSERFLQDEDTLDTWFSSALWPFSTLGWPAKTEELDYFYPTNVLVTADEIIFFWVVRMVFSGYHFMGKKPFRDVIIHGKVLDEHGRKMSKSLGNGVEPLDMIAKYGADTLRLMLVFGNAIDSDIRFSEERLEPMRNFLNKVWNASRFLLMQFEEGGMGGKMPEQAENLAIEDKWILWRLNRAIAEVTEKIEVYELGLAVQEIIDFFWYEFCDWYVEMVKPRLYKNKDTAALWTLKYVLNSALKLLHPFAPFITETIFLKLNTERESIMIENWAAVVAEFDFEREAKDIEVVKEAIKAIRNVRAEKNVPLSKKVKIIAVCETEEKQAAFGRDFFDFLAGAEDVSFRQNSEGVADTAIPVVVQGVTLFLPLEDLVDLAAEKARLLKEQKRLESELARIDGKLANEGFVKKAPPQLIAEEREKREKFSGMLELVLGQLGRM